MKSQSNLLPLPDFVQETVNRLKAQRFASLIARAKRNREASETVKTAPAEAAVSSLDVTEDVNEHPNHLTAVQEPSSNNLLVSDCVQNHNDYVPNSKQIATAENLHPSPEYLRQLWESETPIILPLSGDRCLSIKPIDTKVLTEALAACQDAAELQKIREAYSQDVINLAWVTLPNKEVQRRLQTWMQDSHPKVQPNPCKLIRTPELGEKWFQIQIRKKNAQDLSVNKVKKLGYELPLDNPEYHTLIKQEISAPTASPIKVDTIAYQLVSDAQALANALKPLATVRVLGLDTETTGLDPHQNNIRLIQIAVPDHPVVIVDLAAIAPADLAPLHQLLTNSAIKIGHNLKFDWKFLNQTGLKPRAPYFDTQLASQLLTAGLPGSHSLKAIALQYLGVELDKEAQQSDWSGELSPTQLEYAARDAAILLQLREAMKPKLIEAGLVEAAKLEFEAIPAVAEIELNGMLLDLSKWQVLGLELQQAKTTAAAELGTQLRSGNEQSCLFANYDKVDPNSPSQVLAALTAMGIPVKSTGKNTLISLADKYPVVKTLLEYRKFAKAVASFTEKLPEHIDSVTGRIHPNYNQYGAATGRFSCSNPNLQQVPRGKDVRSCFIPTPGNKLVIADYSQIELRVAAEISGDRTMITAYQEGQDLHRLTASLITGKPLDEISKAERQAGKPVNFGLIYGCGAKKLGQTAENDYGVAKPLEEWETYRKQFFKAYKGIAKWHSQLERDRPMEIRTLSNRRRQWLNCPWITATSNSIVQGTAADITKKALVLLPDALAGTGAKLIGTVHDEILLECPEATALDAARILQKVMVKAGQVYLKLVPVEVEAKVVDSWADK